MVNSHAIVRRHNYLCGVPQVLSAALLERKVVGSNAAIGDFPTVGPCKRRQSLPVWPPTLKKIPLPLYFGYERDREIQRTLLWFLQLKVSRPRPIFRQLLLHCYFGYVLSGFTANGRLSKRKRTGTYFRRSTYMVLWCLVYFFFF